jgi:hypothetical protein
MFVVNLRPYAANRRIVNLMPRHCTCVEPYGNGSVLLARDPLDPRFTWTKTRCSSRRWVSTDDRIYEDRNVPGSASVCEILNDGTHRIEWLVEVLHDDTDRTLLREVVDGTLTFPRPEDLESLNARVAYVAPLFECARTSVAGWMSQDRRREIEAKAEPWFRGRDGMEAAVLDRLGSVGKDIEHPLDQIDYFDAMATLFVVEPIRLYQHFDYPGFFPAPLLEDEQEELLHLLKQCEGKVMLLGPPNDVYDRRLDGWHKHVIQTTCPADESEPEVTEYLWCNYKARRRPRPTRPAARRPRRRSTVRRCPPTP